MRIIGLTGSMGSGKSATAAVLTYLGIPVHSADDAAHVILRHPEIIEEIGWRWPHTVLNGKVNRSLLAKQIFADPKQVDWIEKKVHPLLGLAQKKFLTRFARQGCKIVALDVPLLFETRQELQCDFICVVSTSSLLQNIRLLKRKNMTPTLMRQILSYQIPPYKKRKKATHLLVSGLQRGHLFRQVKKMTQILSKERAPKWSPRWQGNKGRK